ncbi:MAG: hypothetical protein NT135_02880 [Candidatus Berkelbacteria bacterium]|nr:hypothetical protein [Candidatus Berkelbacteria bacterium]
MRILEAQRNLYLKPKDRIIFVLDEGYWDAPIRNLFDRWPYDIETIPAIRRSNQDFWVDQDLVVGKTVAWFMTSFDVSYSPVVEAMRKHGIFVISNPGITPDWIDLISSGMSSKCQYMASLILWAIGEVNSGVMRITARDGTDLGLDIPAQNWKVDAGKRDNTMTCGVFGELSTPPLSGSGRLVLGSGDFLTDPINRVEERIVLDFKNGELVGVSGKLQSEQLLSTLRSTQNPHNHRIGEFTIGLNPARPKEIFRSVVAEKLVNGVHIGIGSPLSMNQNSPDFSRFKFPNYCAGVHIDATKFGATVTFTDSRRNITTLLKRGRLNFNF